ncbi:uncharacterized protein LOC134197846 isoform X2 [Corticium candelabrum]|uniref:uncharacterized protein LOC134197846 isoform X2 n=1 Tax=Corticium candelabrum TaxID=121492 RepID=UPI002E26F3CB|nr:uncharacterized protein LOC134197846 isoform X2 [Corticium candelabrum]
MLYIWNNPLLLLHLLSVPQTISLQIILMSRLRLQEKKESVKLTLQLFAIPLEAWENTYVTRVWQFTSDIAKIKNAVNSLEAKGGGDTPEAVADAIKEVINLNWDEDQRPHTVRMAVLIGDSPPHGTPGLTYDDEFPNGCPAGHDCNVLADQCRLKKINIYTVLCRDDPFTSQAFSSIAQSSGGKCTKIQSASSNPEIIELIKLHVHVQLDRQLRNVAVSDVIVKNPLTEPTLAQRLVRVKDELFSQGVTVRKLEFETGRGVATILMRSICDDDIYEAFEDLKSDERLANTKRDPTLTDLLGKVLYALEKIQRNLSSGAET